jgi:hypothetical protein
MPAIEGAGKLQALGADGGAVLPQDRVGGPVRGEGHGAILLAALRLRETTSRGGRIVADEPPQVPADVPPPGPVQVQIPDMHSDVFYSDQAFVFYSPVGFTLDFAQLTPQAGITRVVARVGMSPAHMKLLVQVLGANLERYEKQFGVVPVTPQMVEEHNRPQQPLGFQPPPPDAPA